ncbi:hypothetical protein [Methanolobus profundi]|uniref:Uncharacterized protein n=1 Tax=Methanolobus profundi TaxID=487685 RepID=A0A1I4UPC4_9EURY|nr:hypothetical protein [Methanolobus profundi]SFM90798.1 hypothetical protein SAMN04488696_2823 [Methanolobus profundi]
MPTTKPMLFLLALLLLIVPASASTITYHESTYGQESSSEGYSDSSYVHGSQTEYLEGDITGYIKFNTAKPLGTPENAYVILGLQNTATGSYYGLASKQNLYGTWNVSFQRSGLPAGYYRQYMYLYCYEYDDDTKRITCTLLNETVVIDSQPEPNDNLVEFAYDEEQPDTWIDVSYFIDDLQESYHELDATVTLDHDYSYYLEFDYDTEPVQVTMPFTLGSSSGTRQFQTPTFPSYPDTVEASLVEVYTVTQTWSGLSAVIEETETILATDTLSVTSSANNTNNETLPEEPEEPDDPILDPPEMPENPFQNGTEENNETGSYDSTFLSGYYGSVDTVGDYLFGPAESGFTYLMYPVTALNDSVNSANVYLLDSSTEMQGYNPIVASIFAPVVNSMPPKVQALITYNLVWLMVLMIFKRK